MKIEEEMGLRIMIASMVVLMLGGGLYGYNVIDDALFYIVTWGFSITLILGFTIYITMRFGYKKEKRGGVFSPPNRRVSAETR